MQIREPKPCSDKGVFQENRHHNVTCSVSYCSVSYSVTAFIQTCQKNTTINTTVLQGECGLTIKEPKQWQIMTDPSSLWLICDYRCIRLSGPALDRAWKCECALVEQFNTLSYESRKPSQSSSGVSKHHDVLLQPLVNENPSHLIYANPPLFSSLSLTSLSSIKLTILVTHDGAH